MNRNHRVGVLAALVAALAAGPAPVTANACQPALHGRCPAWTSTYDSPAPSWFDADVLEATVVDPQGRFVAVTGRSYGTDATGYDTATVAYAPATGAVVWSARFEGPGPGNELPLAITIDPVGERLFVSGERYPAGETGFGDGEAFVVAYEAATGRELWHAVHDGPAGLDDRAYGVSATTQTVVITGVEDHDPGGASDVVPAFTNAYDAATGEPRWSERLVGEGSPDGLSINIGRGVVVTGGRAVVLVFSTGTGPSSIDVDYLTVAYPLAAEGDLPHGEVWRARHDGPVQSFDDPVDLVADPGGDAVYVTGSTFGSASEGQGGIGTVAYDLVDGSVRWSDRYNGPNPNFSAAPAAIAITGTRLVVTGELTGTVADDRTILAFPTSERVTIAYDARTGERAWAVREGVPARVNAAAAVAVTEDGSVYVGGFTRERFSPPGPTRPASAVVLAYEPDGSLRWSATDNSSDAGVHDVQISALAVAGDRVVAGATAVYDVSSFWGIYTHGAGVDGPGNISDFRVSAYAA